jgi:P-type Cu2+ transporter
MSATTASHIPPNLPREPRVDTLVDAGTCFHCGAPAPGDRIWRDIVAATPRTFCCAGCLAVAQTIDAAGLAGFYSTRTRDAVRLPTEDPDEWMRWDESAAIAGLVRDGDPHRHEVSLLVEGLNCGACVSLLETWLMRQPGVTEARVNFSSRRALVSWQPGQTRLSTVLRAVAAIGYRAHPYDPARGEALGRSERRTLLGRMAVAILTMMQVMMFALPSYVSSEGVAPEQQRLLDWASFVLTLPALVYSAVPFFLGAWRDVAHRRLGMDLPVALGIGTAFAASAWSTFAGAGPVYYDSVTMFIALLLVARYGELVARQRAGAAIELVARQRPATAERLGRWPRDAAPETIAAARLAPGDIVLIRPGAIIPADGAIVDGRSHVEEALLTGESEPRLRAPGDTVFAGCVNRDSPLVLRVHAAGEATRLSSILRLVERAASERPAVARAADRAAGWFVGALGVLAVVVAIIWWQFDPARVLPVTVALLVVSCPCALSLATPAAVSATAGSLARRGVVLVRSDALETLARVTHVVLDKTGTLTQGSIRLVACRTIDDLPGVNALALAAAVDARSEHPLARALRDAAGETMCAPHARDFRQEAAQGVEASIDGLRVRVGRPAFVAILAGVMPAALREFAEDKVHRGALVGLGNAHGWQAMFAFEDTLRPGASRLVDDLQSLGIRAMVLSGDRQASVDHVAGRLGIAEAQGDLSPDEKRAIIARLQAQGAIVAMMGDGINDAPALAQAHVSISLGTAAPLAQQTADVVILSDRIESAETAMREARRAFTVIRQNLAWAAIYNAIAIPAAALGIVTPLVAAAGMSLSSLVVVANALRLTRSSARPDCALAELPPVSTQT